MDNGVRQAQEDKPGKQNQKNQASKTESERRDQIDNLRCIMETLPARRNYRSPWAFFHFNIAKIQSIYL